MNLLRAAEFKVGVLVLAIAALIAYMSLQVSGDPSYMGRSNEAWFLLTDAGGLVKNSSVRMAGISMGIIKDIKLQDGMARVEITVRPDIKLYVSAAVEIKSQGILGDKHVELYPGVASDPPLSERGQILNVRDKGSMDKVMGQIGEIAVNLKEVAQVLKDSFSKDGNRENILGRIVQNIEKLTKDFSDITSDNKSKISQIVEQMNRITETVDDALNDESDEGFKTVWKKTLARINSTMKNLDEISGRVNRGEGTIGKLISDEDTSEKVTTAVDGISNIIEATNKISTGLDFSSAYMSLAKGEETAINVKIQPGLDRYYLLGVVNDPFGYVTTVQTVDAGSPPANYVETKTYQNQIKFNAQFAKVFYDFTLRGGLMENYGGFGIDYTFYKNRASVSLDLFNFSSINVRPSAKFQIWKGFYLYGGIYDAMNSAASFSPYLGAGLTLTNDDLKLLLAKSPL